MKDRVQPHPDPLVCNRFDQLSSTRIKAGEIVTDIRRARIVRSEDCWNFSLTASRGVNIAAVFVTEGNDVLWHVVRQPSTAQIAARQVAKMLGVLAQNYGGECSPR